MGWRLPLSQVSRCADTYLLDDSLSAVDALVGKHLFQNCIQGFLKNKSVILVTHQLKYLQEADEIIVLQHGQVEKRGNFQHLLKTGTDFSSFLGQEGTVEEEEVSPETYKDTLDIPKNPLAKMQSMSVMAESDSISVGSEATATDDVKVKNEYNKRIEEEMVNPEQVKEQRSSGSLKFKVYKDYFLNGGNWFAVIFMFFMNILCQALYSGSDVWLSFWTGQEEKKLERFARELKSDYPIPTEKLFGKMEQSK